MLEIGPQGVVHAALHQVRPLIGGLHRRVARAHHIGVVARAPGQHIRDTADVREDVIQAVPGPVDSRPREGQVLELAPKV